MQISQFSIPGDFIDLGVGQPEPRLLPLELFQTASAHALHHSPREILQYGAEAGDDYFRSSLAGFLSKHYEEPVSAHSLFTTNGISQALAMICTLFTKPGDTIIVEEPTYFYALDVFRDYHLNIVSLAVDQDGLNVEALEHLLETYKPAFIYTIPAFQNPTGTTLSLARRERLIELAEKVNSVIVADEVYQLLYYTSRPPKPLGCFESDHVLSLGSFAKILAPGLRLGWIQAGPRLLKRCAEYGAIASGGGLNPFTSAIVRSAIELGLQDKHLEFLQKTYSQRSGALVQALRQNGFNVPDVQGGYFVWLNLRGQDTKTLQQRAKTLKVDFKPGSLFSSSGGLSDCLRLCFAYYPPEKLEEGVERLIVSLKV